MQATLKAHMRQMRAKSPGMAWDIKLWNDSNAADVCEFDNVCNVSLRIVPTRMQ